MIQNIDHTSGWFFACGSSTPDYPKFQFIVSLSLHPHAVLYSMATICHRKTGNPSSFKRTFQLHDSTLEFLIWLLGTMEFKVFLQKTFYRLIHKKE
jgi:hypothetical protein